jgi:hypothetical protein
LPPEGEENAGAAAAAARIDEGSGKGGGSGRLDDHAQLAQDAPMASRTAASVTVTTLVTPRRMIAKLRASGQGAVRPSATVPMRSGAMGAPAVRESRRPAAPAGWIP